MQGPETANPLPLCASTITSPAGCGDICPPKSRPAIVSASALGGRRDFGREIEVPVGYDDALGRYAWSADLVFYRLLRDLFPSIPPPPNAPRERIAYKTGTSYSHRDTWAVGYDGQYVVVVWMGRADGTPVPGAFGADMAAPILFEAFSRVSRRVTPLGPPPPGTLMVSHDALPAPLREFRARNAVFRHAKGSPELAFPPDGATIETAGGAVAVKIRDGRPPFTVLANGAPVIVASHARETMLDLSGPGHVMLSVIDADGRAARARVELR